ncbi:MAG: pyridoxal-phosphate dependent enzyme, partial [Polyangiaceae bacterium]|nr:pyridoxal-phosphate dependent enzyme [Polyangiaceae bacterium]
MTSKTPAPLVTPRLSLAHTPTPIVRTRALEVLGLADRKIDLWIKRDDATGGPEAGNKIRKLEFLLADAQKKNATTLVTCGGIQSNHARATAVLAAQLGLKSVLMLRTTEAMDNLPTTGNVLIDRMVGAETCLVTPAEYRDRAAQMAAIAKDLEADGQRPYVIPEGGSNGLGSLGYVQAMEEVAAQVDAGACGAGPFDVVIHACGSGGTAAGVALGAARSGIATEVHAMAVCDDVAYFREVTERIIGESRALEPTLPVPARLVIDDREKGPRYGVANDDQKRL